MKRRYLAALLVASALMQTSVAMAQGPTVSGITESEIKLGQTVSLCGPVSAYATFSRASLAYFVMA